MAETGGAKTGAQDQEKDLRVSIPKPMPPAKSTLVQLVGTVNTLWGSDRILRTGQFLGRYIGGSGEVCAGAGLWLCSAS